MNILFCGDKGVCDGIFLSVLSICKNTKEKINIYILTASIGAHAAIPQHIADRLKTSIEKKQSGNTVALFDISKMFCNSLPLANMGTRFTPLCMLRLFADMVPEIPDKILYLDADVLCRADFKDFYDSDLGGIEIAGFNIYLAVIKLRCCAVNSAVNLRLAVLYLAFKRYFGKPRQGYITRKL